MPATEVQTEPIADQTLGNGEVAVDAPFRLLTEREFPTDFVQEAQNATEQVGLETMQFEVNADTAPIFQAVKEADERGLDTRFHYDRMAHQHIRTAETKDGKTHQAYVALGRVALRLRHRSSLQQAVTARHGLTRELEDSKVASPAYRKRGHHKRLSHNHVKLAIADDVAWFGSMNLRGIDFEMSNFMMKTRDPEMVDSLKEIFNETEKPELGEDREFPIYDENGEVKTSLILDAGVKGRSAIFERAREMADSLGPGDEFVFISQWPPVEGRIGKRFYGDLLDKLRAKTQGGGTRGTYLMSPERHHHPIKRAARALQRRVKAMEAADPNMTAVNLARQTHAKAFLIKRADGSREVLFGSHNSSKWTVRNGTRELSMWSRDPQIVDQVAGFIDSVQGEEPLAH